MANTYGFDPVAWSIDGGRHRGELLRVLAYVASGGAEGVVAPGDCRVHQVGTGTTQIAMDAGALLIRNRSSNARNQTYAANGRTETRLDVDATGTSARSDLVVVRIEDPQYSPWQKPPVGTEPDYQYVKPFIIKNVPSTTVRAEQLNLGYSAYAVARLDLPANTTNITDAVIRDLRRLAQPREHREIDSWTTPNGRVLDTVSPAFDNWPNRNYTVEVPLWATEVSCLITLQGIGNSNQPADGDLRGRIQVPAVNFDSWSGSLRYDLDPGSTGGGYRVGFTVTVSTKLPESARGQQMIVGLYGNKFSWSPGTIGTNESSHMAVDVQFYERVV